MPFPSRVLALEEHAAFPSLGDGSSDPFYTTMWSVFPQTHQKLWSYSSTRLTDMDLGHITMQILSHLPGTSNTNPSACIAANNEMSLAIKAHPDRFGGFAALPMAFPEEAERELERCVRTLGFRGAMVDNCLEDGGHFDDEKFWGIFECADRLDVPIYLHPAPPSQGRIQREFVGNYDLKCALGLSTAAWGWHENVGLHILKLYAAGLFERFPRLKIIIGHMGEMVPFMLDRIERLPFFKTEGKKSLKQVWDRNIWVTTSGMFSLNPMATLLKTTKVEHILYSVDYPFESNEVGWGFIEELSKSEIITEEELEMIVYGNAEKLLKLNERQKMEG